MPVKRSGQQKSGMSQMGLKIERDVIERGHQPIARLRFRVFAATQPVSQTRKPSEAQEVGGARGGVTPCYRR